MPRGGVWEEASCGGIALLWSPRSAGGRGFLLSRGCRVTQRSPCAGEPGQTDALDAGNASQTRTASRWVVGAPLRRLAHLEPHQPQLRVGVIVAKQFLDKREGDRTYRGELYGIYLLQAHQNRGLGRQLASAVAQCLLDNGVNCWDNSRTPTMLTVHRLVESGQATAIGAQVARELRRGRQRQR